MALTGPSQLALAMETARNYMFESAPWFLANPLEKIGAERHLKNELSAALEQGFALHDPNHPELRYFDQQSQFGLINPDNRYYMATIAFPGEYVIYGKKDPSPT